MKLADWMRNHSADERLSLAKKCGTSVGYLYKLAGKHGTPSLVMAKKIELHTDGRVNHDSFVSKEDLTAA